MEYVIEYMDPKKVRKDYVYSGIRIIKLNEGSQYIVVVHEPVEDWYFVADSLDEVKEVLGREFGKAIEKVIEEAVK